VRFSAQRKHAGEAVNKQENKKFSCLSFVNMSP
jgi:hypothetical protein